MAEEETLLSLRDDYYRDSIAKVIFLIGCMIAAIGILIAACLYLYFNKPAPIAFPVDKEWRIQPPVPLNQPYLSRPDLLQWVSDVVEKVFVIDFVNYNDQLQTAMPYFTTDGWKVFLNQLNIYANYNNVQAYKMFIKATPTGAPIVRQEGLLSGKYAWWVQMPINLSYAGYEKAYKQPLTLQILVVRVSTLNNLAGVGIDNVIVSSKNTGTLSVNG